MRVKWRMPVLLAIFGLLVGSISGSTIAADEGEESTARNIPVGPPLPNTGPNHDNACELLLAFPGGPVPAPPSCTVYSGNHQAPRGLTILRTASVEAGANGGQIRFVTVRSLRSRAQPPGQPPAGIICCYSPVQSATLTLTPNQVNTFTVNMPMVNTVINIDGEDVEVVDYLGISLMNNTGTLPVLLGANDFLLAFGPAIPASSTLNPVLALQGAFPQPAAVLIRGSACDATPRSTARSTEMITVRQQCPPGLEFPGLPGPVVPGEPGSPGTPSSPGTPGGSGSSEFVGITPARLLDTRGGETTDGEFSGGGKLQGGQEIALDVAGRDDVPDDADAVVLNVTVTDPENFGFITAYPCGIPRPNVSNINFTPDQTVPNSVIVKVGSNGRVCLFSDQTTHMLADVGGFLPSTSSYEALDPARFLDTRGGETFDGAFSTGAKLQGGQEIALDIAGRGDVPDDADAVVLTVTVNDPDVAGFITAYPCGTMRPNASNLNYVPGQTIANTVVSKVGSNGRVCLFSDQTTHLLADVGGAFPSGSGFTSLDPARFLDTRGADTFDGAFSTGAKLQGGQEIALDIAGRGDVPDDADAVVMNVTVNDPDNFGFVTAYPCGVDRPTTSNLNYAPGQTIPNSVIVKVGGNGRVCLFSDQTTHLFADVSGYFD